MQHPIRIAVVGAGGLGRAALRLLAHKQEAKVVALCDRGGYAFCSKGFDAETATALENGGCAALGEPVDDSIGALIHHRADVDAMLLTLPNLPNEFMPGVVERIVDAGYSGVFVDALKRTRAMQLMFALDEKLRAARCVAITGAGATPGLLSAAAVLAAQSFVEVERVDIWWGVGIANWDAYRATIREDIAHLPGYSVERAAKMTDAEIDALLAETDGKLTLRDMEHADDLLLQKVGVVDRLDQVTVGGVMDTRSAQKPVQTTMTLTGTTFEGKRSSHRFVLGNETSMAANVLGPALGYLKRALWLRERGIYGVFGSTEFMPMVLR
ncbi:saccharopine dehydrogenase-like oxidoreductase [bacterium]|nr:saccharopine dehydrogenase-like oxidoreductase [bacterium]